MSSAYGRVSLPIGTTSVAPQANIKTNVGVEPNLLDIRQSMVRNADPSQIVIDPTSVNAGGLSILCDEIVVAEKTRLFPGNKMSAFNIFGFSSFAGILAPDRNQQKFEERFIPLGFATSKFDPTGDAPSNDGVSCRKKGSGSTLNTSDQIFYPGDVIAAQFPFLDPEKRAQQYKVLNSLTIPGSQSAFPKPIATIKKVTYADTFNSFREVAKNLVVNNQRVSVPNYVRRIRSSPYSDDESTAQQLSSVLKMVTGTFGMSLVTSMIQHGLLVPTCPNYANVLTSETDRLNWIASMGARFKDGMLVANNSVWVPGPTDDGDLDDFIADLIATQGDANRRNFFRAQAQTWGGRFEDIEAVRRGSRAIAIENQIGALAAIAGVVSDETKDATAGFVENVELTSVHNTRALFGSLGGLDNYAMMKDLLFRTVSAQTISRTNGLGTVIEGKSTPIAQLHKAYMEVSPMLCHLMGKSFDNAYRLAMCVATSTSSPGELVNYA